MLRVLGVLLLARVTTGCSAKCAEGQGITSPYDTAVCCPNSCVSCAGDGCHLRNGGAANCCASSIRSANKTCGSPPCILSDGEASHNICSAGILNGDICCKRSCGERFCNQDCTTMRTRLRNFWSDAHFECIDGYCIDAV
eukprot:9604-Heterococcus_DN1.PRE.3